MKLLRKTSKNEQGGYSETFYFHLPAEFRESLRPLLGREFYCTLTDEGILFKVLQMKVPFWVEEVQDGASEERTLVGG